MHIFLDNFFQGGKYSAQIASHQVELRRGEIFTDQKYLSISSLHNYYLNIDSISGCGKNSEKANIFQTKCTFCGGANHSAENISIVSERKRKNLVQLVISKTDVRNARLINDLDADLKII